MSSRLSVIVPTAHRQSMVLRFIDSLNQQTSLPQELIIVDGAASDEAGALYRAGLRAEVTLKYLPCEMGLTRQRNRGIDACEGDIVCFFDDDVVLEPGYLRAVADAFNAPGNADVAAVTGMITNASAPPPAQGLVQRLRRAGETAIRDLCFLPKPGDAHFLPSGMPTFLMQHPEETDCECLAGCCMAFRRTVLADSRFDERLSRYCYMEDDDIAYRVTRHMRARYVPSARGAHLHSAGNRLTAFAAAKMLMVNHHYLFRKNFPQDFPHRSAHLLSLVGYPMLAAWALNWRRFAGASAGLWSIAARRDPLSALERP